MRPILASVLVFALAAAAAAASAQTRAQTPAAVPTRTKDRLPDDQMRRIVAEPLDAMLEGRVAAGEAEFEALLKRRAAAGPAQARAVASADALSAMGTLLFNSAPPSDPAGLRPRAVNYLARAIAATRIAFGDRDPELALALTDYVEAAMAVYPDNPPPYVDIAAGEAFGIRLVTLGDANDETIEALSTLASIKGLASRTHGDPVNIRKAVDLFDQALALGGPGSSFRPVEYGETCIDLARMYADNADGPHAMLTLARAETAFASAAEVLPGVRGRLVFDALGLASLLERRGDLADAATVRRRYSAEMAAIAASAR